jgi:hypothetical protein
MPYLPAANSNCHEGGLLTARPFREVAEEDGGRDWDRTSDPCDVNAVATPLRRSFPYHADANGPVPFVLGSPVSWAFHGQRMPRWRKLPLLRTPGDKAQAPCPTCAARS